MAIFFGAYSSEEFVCEFDKYGTPRLYFNRHIKSKTAWAEQNADRVLPKKGTQQLENTA